MVDPAEDSALAQLVRWTASGGHWRLVEDGQHGAEVRLFTCDGGTEVGRLRSDDPDFLYWIRTAVHT